MGKISEISLQCPGVAHAITISGLSFVQQANGPNFGSMFLTLAPFSERKDPSLTDEAIMARLRPLWAKAVKDAQVLAFGAPPVPGLSVAGGFKLMVEDRGGLGLTTLEQQTNKLVGAQSRTVASGRILAVSLEDPATFLGYRPCQGGLAGSALAGRQPDAANLPRIALRQQLQRLWPPLAGQRPGRGRLPQLC